MFVCVYVCVIQSACAIAMTRPRSRTELRWRRGNKPDYNEDFVLPRFGRVLSVDPGNVLAAEATGWILSLSSVVQF